ncbi:MAG: pitrilysin family protein [Microcoleaceae cyanobacterium]
MSTLLTATQFPAKVLTLDNGLTLIHQEISATPVVVVDVWVRAGAIREPEPWSGMAHFLEHMIFKGSDKVAPGVFDDVIESRGGVANAATSHDYAHFYIETASQYLEETLPTLAEILLNATISETEFERERDVVFEEIHQAQDSIDWVEFQTLMETTYQHHPYGRSVLGTKAALMGRSPEEMRCFHHCNYQPENMAVVVVGGVEQQRVIDLVSKAFNHFPKADHCPQIRTAPRPINPGIRRTQRDLPQLEQARLSMAWTGPGVEQLRVGYGLDLLSVLLAEGRTSRLIKTLREDLQLVHCIDSSFSLQQQSSLLTISALLEPEHLKTVEAMICDSLFELQTQLISHTELNRIQRLLCNDYSFSTETPAQIAGLYGYYFTISQPELSVTYPDKIQSFQPRELQHLAQQYLDPQNYAVTVLQPA